MTFATLPADASPRPAFISLMASLFATIAFAIDAMLPTVAAAGIASVLGLVFDGTAGPLAAGITAGLAAALVVLPKVRQ